MKLTIGWLYPKLLNLYGDSGNIECLVRRCEWRGKRAEVLEFAVGDKFNKNVDILFMGGGPDLSQKALHKDFLSVKGKYISDYIEGDGVSLFVCGGYQLLGKFYRSFDGEDIPGLGAIDMYTKHFGRDKPRCVGNLIFESSLVGKVVGFENHGGRSYLGKGLSPLGKVIMGCGNNGEDKTEGILYRNTFGTYSHGPLLPKNPNLSDLLISKALGEELKPLEDSFENLARKAALKLKR